jgi:dienelactone hydrolase
MGAAEYDPFATDPHQVDVRTIVATDQARGRLFPIEIWSPAQSGLRPLIVFSHYSGGNRRTATYLCRHLASHGYVVAAMDHSEVVAPELARRADETAEERTARINDIITSRVPDVRFLLDHLLGGGADIEIETSRIGLVGHSFGGWTVLATPEVESGVRSVVALAPGGSSSPKPGILPVNLSFDWGRDVPTLYLAAENDVPIPLAGVYELFDRTRSSKRISSSAARTTSISSITSRRPMRRSERRRFLLKRHGSRQRCDRSRSCRQESKRTRSCGA